jgi:NAD(P)-dependent dehydrogenase (short-subunit alcohol dehydrogenase family)
VFADLTGRAALITGAGRGIGRGIAEVLARQQAAVAVTDEDETAAHDVADRIGKAAIAVHLDVTDPVSVIAAFAAATEEWGRIDILVNNAGISTAPDRGSTVDSEEDWDRTFDVNVKGTVRCCEVALPAMTARGHGRIINLASMAGHAARGTGGAYAASKAAVLRYTKGLAAAAAAHGVTVNAVCPGAVWTRFQERDMANLQRSDPRLTGLEPEAVFRRRYGEVIPTGRPQTPEEIGSAVAFLACDEARSITGQCLHVDGGAILRD